MYAEDEKKYGYIKYIILGGIIVAIIIILYFALFSFDKIGTKKNDFEKLILKDAETFVKINNLTATHFITLSDIESVVPTSYDTCNKSTGVLYSNGKYELYVQCSNYESKTIEDINNQTYKYITLKEDAFLITSNVDFKDPGYVSNYKVETLGNTRYSTQGLYITTYLVKDNSGSILEQAKRYVIYSNYNNDLKTSTMELLGEKEIYIKKGSVFKDPGVKVIDSSGNDLSKNVKVTGSVNTSVPGTYKINYVLNQLTETRTVIVTSMDVNATLSTTDYTNKSIYIILDINSSDYDGTRLPDQTVSTDKYIKYEVSKNGTYNFYVRSKYDEGVQVTKEVTNIDKIKPSATCIGKSENKVTTVQVTANDASGIKYYKYGTFSNNVTNSSYVINQTINGLWVTVTDNAGNQTEVSCNITVITPPKEEKPQTPTHETADPNGSYKRVRLTYFDDAGLAKCGSTCVQNKMASGDIKLDEHGWYMYKYNGEWYHVIATAINNPTLIDKYGHASYTDITYYNYYDTFTVYISDTSSSSSDTYPDSKYKAYKVIVLDVCGACSKFSKYLQDIHPPWTSTTIEKWRSDAYKGNSIKLDLWVSPDKAINPADWAFINK